MDQQTTIYTGGRGCVWGGGGVTGKNTEKMLCSLGQVCFQHNINFPFIKSPMQRPPVLTALLAPCGGPLRPVGRGSLGVQVSWALYLTIFIGQYAQFIHTAPPQSVAPTHCSTGMPHCRKDQSSNRLCERKCVQECVCMSNKGGKNK